MHSRLLPIILMAATLAAILPAVSIAGAVEDDTDRSGIKLATGIAPVLNDDVVRARDIAIMEAKRKAVEQVGVHLDAETLYSMALPQADWLTIKAGGYIRDFVVLSEKRSGRRYEVQIKAWVIQGDKLHQTSRRLLSAKKMLFVGSGRGSREIELLLAQELKRQGYRYHDSRYVQANVQDVTWKRLLERRLPELDQDCFDLGADWIVRIESDVQHRSWDPTMVGNWYDGRTEISVYQISGGQAGELVIAPLDKISERMFVPGSTAEEKQLRKLLITMHPNGYRNQIAKPLVDSVARQMWNLPGLNTTNRKVRVTLKNASSVGDSDKFMYILKNTRGVEQRVAEVAQNGAAYTFEVVFPMKPIYLVYLLKAHPRYEITAHGRNEIEVTVKKRT